MMRRRTTLRARAAAVVSRALLLSARLPRRARSSRGACDIYAVEEDEDLLSSEGMAGVCSGSQHASEKEVSLSEEGKANRCACHTKRKAGSRETGLLCC